MTSFVHLDYSTQHPGVARVEAVIDSAQHMKRNFSSTRSLAMLLLSAIAAAVMVVAYQIMNSIVDGHLLVLWMGMWAVAFASLAAFAGTAREAAFKVKTSLDAWSSSVAAKRADERLWAMAKSDPRLMADLQAIMSRDSADSVNAESLRFVAPVVVKSDWLVSSKRYGTVAPYL